MSYTPPAPPPPPPGTGSMTVPNPLPPKPPRPAGVEAASWMLLGFAAVMAAGLAVSAIALIRAYSRSGFYLTPSLFLPLTIVAAIVLMLTVRMGSDAARLAALGLCGAVTGFALTQLLYALVLPLVNNDPISSRSSASNASNAAGILVTIVIMAVAVAVMILLMGAKASWWFHAMKAPRPVGAPTGRPATVLITILLLAALVLVTVLYLVVYLLSIPPGASALLLVPGAASDLVLIIALAVSALLLGIGNDSGRYISVALCAYFFLAACYTLIDFVYIVVSSPQSINTYLVMDQGLALAQLVLGAVGYVLLSLRTTADWFHSRRFPPPRDEPVDGPAPVR